MYFCHAIESKMNQDNIQLNQAIQHVKKDLKNIFKLVDNNSTKLEDLSRRIEEQSRHINEHSKQIISQYSLTEKYSKQIIEIKTKLVGIIILLSR